uniref:Minor capsid protein n=1 Tax=Siphoviridae sp. ctvok7 TaxID=2827596 RepID=A0A8S5LLX4_9CAUD|nr:MAG TPA: minor capsid protein [Siphoviridae sp. ctvok7]
MPTLNRAPNEKELEKLIQIFLKAETDIINEIGRLRSQGLIDYHAVAALERVQAILRQMESDSWEWAPRMVEKQFYVRVPEARKALEVPETVEKHLAGYSNAAILTGEQHLIIDNLVMNLMGEITDASMTVMATLQSALIGRVEPDIYRQVGLEQVAYQQAVGRGVNQAIPAFADALRREGVTAFVDKAGRRWSLHTYCSMVSRTTSRQAEVMAVLTADPEHDLYRISSHGTTCKICAPFEGRVYSRSGTDPDYPPLAAALGKQDPAGPDILANTWLNIHPGCLHSILPYTTVGRSEEEIQKIKDFSNPKKNPFTRDPRTQKEIDAYRKKETARRHWLQNYRQWESYRITLGDKVPKTYQAFERHKRADDEKYKEWQRLYREANKDDGN